MKNLQKVDFTGKTIFVGIDVHNKNWMVRVKYEDTITKAIPFTPDPHKLANYLRKYWPGAYIIATYEAGYSGFWIYDELTEEGVKTVVANPADVPTKGKEQTNKTDKIDTKKLVENLASGQIEGIYVPTVEQRQDRALARLRNTLVKNQTRYKNRIKAMLQRNGIKYPEQFSESGSHWSNAFLNWLESLEFRTSSGKQVMLRYLKILRMLREEILQVTRDIRNLGKSEKYKKHCELLISIDGIGLITAMTLLTEIMDMSRFRQLKHLTSFIGLVPREHSSGDKQRMGHISHRGNNLLRRIIVEAAWRATSSDPALQYYYNEAKKRVGAQRAIIKVARKLLSRIRYVWINEEKYVRGVA